jgi:hypothetical protein
VIKLGLAIAAIVAGLAVPVGCGSRSTCTPADGGTVLSVEECEACNGSVISDPGDGRTHRDDFRCPNGDRSWGSVRFGIEGGACCPP